MELRPLRKEGLSYELQSRFLALGGVISAGAGDKGTGVLGVTSAHGQGWVDLAETAAGWVRWWYVHPNHGSLSVKETLK